MEFLKLLGDLDVVTRQFGPPEVAPRAFPGWSPLPEEKATDPILDEFRIPPDAAEQPQPLPLQVLFRPRYEGVYDVEWLAQEGTALESGEVFARLYRVSDGLRDEQAIPFPAVVRRWRVRRNDKVIAGGALVDCQIPSIALPDGYLESRLRGSFMDFALAVNATIKGWMGSIDQSAAITAKVIPVSVQLDTGKGMDALTDQMIKALGEHELLDGDIVVTSEKIIAIAQGRLFPLRLLNDTDPKTHDRASVEELLEQVRAYVADADYQDLLCADSLPDHEPEPMATAGVRDPNRVAAQLAGAIQERLDRTCDVVVSDTDTGLDVRQTLIGTITIGATPLGATAGLVLYECMRVANAAEFCRGSGRTIPLVICRPHKRRARRVGTGEHRGYAGRLDAAREELKAFA